jgi:hypothetical protein
MKQSISSKSDDRKTDDSKSNSLEIRREQWQRQLMADPKLTLSQLKVAISIGFHFNRNQGGQAWPGIAKIAEVACVDRRTVIRANESLVDRGHLQKTKGRKGLRNLPNRYLPLLKRNGNIALPVPPPSGIATPPPSGRAVSPEPYTEPLSEPNIPISISATSGDVVALKKGDFRKSNKEKKPPGIESQCFDLARKHYGPTASALVTKALRTMSAEEVMLEIQDAIESGDELGCVLWRP